MSDSYTMERVINIWNDKNGKCITVGPDSDALGLLQITVKHADGKENSRISLTKTEALLVAEAITNAISLNPDVIT